MNKILRYSFVALMAMIMGNVFAAEVTDKLTWDKLLEAGKSSSYQDFSGKTISSSAVYVGQASSGNDNYIQLRTNNNNAGIVTAVSGGKLKSVTITFNEKTTDRAIEIYGKNEAYTAATDLYGDAKGTLLKAIAANDESKTLTVEGDYAFVGLKSANGAIYVDAIEITWTTAEGEEQGQAWDFTKWSDATIAALKAEAAKGISGGTWSDVESESKTSEWPKDKCYWQVAVQANDLKAGDVEITETKGLKFINTSDRALAIAVNYPLADQDESKNFGPYKGGAYLWLGGKNINYFIIPNVAAGSVIEMGVESHKITDARGVQLFAGADETGTLLKAPDGTDVAYPKTYTEQKWQMPADATTTDVCVRNNNGCHIYYIKVTAGTASINAVKTAQQDGSIYNFAGQKVGKDYKGLVIKNGKKFVQK